MRIMRFMSKNKKKSIYISRIRNDLSLLGYDASIFTDDQIEQGVIEFQRMMNKSGFTAYKASNALKKVFKSGLSI